jgi:hypothetical protein
MILNKLAISIILATTISSCSILGTKKVEVVSKPVQLDIIQPTLPREIDLTPPNFYVVSEAVIANPCKRNDEGKRDCTLGKENDWPEGYTYLDRFLDEMKDMNNGEVVFVAMSIGDYKVMSANIQELRRYIKQLGEVVVYYRNVTMPNGQPGVAAQIEKK